MSLNNSSARLRYRRQSGNQKFMDSKAKTDSVSTDDSSYDTSSSVSERLVDTGSSIYDSDITNTSSNNYDYKGQNDIFNFSKDKILSGIIFSEILGEPRAKRNWRNR